MPASNKTMIHKLQTAINTYGEKILIDHTQFYSDEQQRAVTLYKVCKSVQSEGGKNKREKLFETPSSIQVVLFLRDYLFMLQEKPIPTDNEQWNEIKKQKGIVFEYNVKN